MTGYNKVFLDTTPLIYFLDDDANFGERAREILEEVIGRGAQLVTSVITCTEYLVYPYRTCNEKKVDVFFEFLYDFDVETRRIDLETARRAASIRAQYQGFKCMDSLQLSSAVQAGCDLFLTNDKQLRQFDGLRCVTVEEWDPTAAPPHSEQES